MTAPQEHSTMTAPHSTPGAQLICGPMFAGKTERLLDVFETYAPGTALLVKLSWDVRYSATSVVSHGGRSRPADMSVAPGELISKVLPRLAPPLVAVCLDECQFLGTELAAFVDAAVLGGFSVHLAGLLAQSGSREPFPGIPEVMVVAETITRLPGPKCHHCGTREGTCSARHDVNSTVTIGGSESYVTLCRDCWCKHNKKKN